MKVSLFYLPIVGNREQIMAGMAGTVDTVKRQLEKMRERQPVNWVFAWMYNGVLENSVLMNTIEKFGREIQTN